MPIYEFECAQCHYCCEIIQKISDPAPETCDHCGKKNTLAKKVSNTSFHLKGDGWYKDLYSSAKPKDASASSTTTESSSTKKAA